MTDDKLREAGFTYIGHGTELWARVPLTAGTTLQHRGWAEREAADILAARQREAEQKAKYDRLTAAGWGWSIGDTYTSLDGTFYRCGIDAAIAELDRREAAAKIPPKPRNPFLERHGWRPRWNAEQRLWWWDHDERGKGFHEAVAEQRQQEFNKIQAAAKIPPKPRNPLLERHGWRPRWNGDWLHRTWYWDHDEHGDGMSEIVAENIARYEGDRDAAQPPAPRPTCATCGHWEVAAAGKKYGRCKSLPPTYRSAALESDSCSLHPGMAAWIRDEFPKELKRRQS